MRFGRHMPTESRPVQALRQLVAMGGDAMQLFVTNPRSWQAPAYNLAEEQAMRAARAELGDPALVAHAAYLINLASPRDDYFTQSVALLRATLDRTARIGGESVVFHIGSHTGSGVEAGLARLIDGIAQALAPAENANDTDGAPGVDGASYSQPLLLLENDTGGGGKLGDRFEHLARALDALPEHADRLGVCLDTAHLWGAGFDIGTPEGASATLDEVDRVIGLARVRALHVNDSREPLASHRDVHARLGEGTIPLVGMQAFLCDPRLTHTTALLETPLPTLPNKQVDWQTEREIFQRARALAGLPTPEGDVVP
jgi:deoxyribonuclease-4